MKIEKFLYRSSIIGSLLASVCCVGPLILILFGIGSIGLFSEFNVLRPYLLVVTGLFLGVAFYLSFRKKKLCCNSKRDKIFLWPALLFFIFVVALPMLGFDNINSINDKNVSSNTSLKTIDMRISNIDCAACAIALEKQLEKIEGVYDAKVNFPEENWTIEYDSLIISKKSLSRFLKDKGFASKDSY